MSLTSLPWSPISTSRSTLPTSKSGVRSNDSAFVEEEEEGGEGDDSPLYREDECNSSTRSSPCRLDYEYIPSTGFVYNVSEAEECLYSDKRYHSSDPVTKQKIMKSMVCCIHKGEGCNWSGQLCKLKGHLNVCQKDAMACPNQCGSKIARVNMEDHMLYTCTKRLIPCLYCKRDFTGAVIDDHLSECGFEPLYCDNKCGQKIQRNRLKAHQINTCSKRLVSCRYCNRSFTAETLQSHHSKCYMFPVPCPNRCGYGGEGMGIPREDVERHLAEECGRKRNLAEKPEETPEKFIKCKFHDVGCRFRCRIEPDMTLHMTDHTSTHLDLMCRFVQTQKLYIRKLMNQIEYAHTSYNGVLIWKIKNLNSKMRESRCNEGLELISIPFFTSSPQCGYKLQASLFLNGNGGGEGTHISVYIKLLPGEYDSVLKWPFKHTVSFTLLDQTEEKKKAVNVVESFIPDPTWPNFRKPNKDQLGFGFPKFVSHAMLNTRNYIKEDCIFLKIRVDPARNVAV